MNNKEAYDDAFCRILEVNKDRLDDLSFKDVPAWDSIGHMQLLTELEEIFNIDIMSDDVLEFSSYKKGMEILNDKYNVEF